MSEYHTPVMLDESISALVTNPSEFTLPVLLLCYELLGKTKNYQTFLNKSTVPVCFFIGKSGILAPPKEITTKLNVKLCNLYGSHGNILLGQI